MRSSPWAAALVSLLLVGPSGGQADDEPAVVTVAVGKQVEIEYTLRLDDGSTADSNVGGEPLAFMAGQQEILPALEQELVGLKLHDTKKVTLPPEQGYGPVDPNKFETVRLSAIPEIARRPGTRLLGQQPDGTQRRVRVHQVLEDTIVIDLNHPLAGQNLNFEIKIIRIE